MLTGFVSTGCRNKMKQQTEDRITQSMTDKGHFDANHRSMSSEHASKYWSHPVHREPALFINLPQRAQHDHERDYFLLEDLDWTQQPEETTVQETESFSMNQYGPDLLDFLQPNPISNTSSWRAEKDESFVGLTVSPLDEVLNEVESLQGLEVNQHHQVQAFSYIAPMHHDSAASSGMRASRSNEYRSQIPAGGPRKTEPHRIRLPYSKAQATKGTNPPVCTSLVSDMAESACLNVIWWQENPNLGQEMRQISVESLHQQMRSPSTDEIALAYSCHQGEIHVGENQLLKLKRESQGQENQMMQAFNQFHGQDHLQTSPGYHSFIGALQRSDALVQSQVALSPLQIQRSSSKDFKRISASKDKDEPKRPLTAYNFFFRDTRAQVISKGSMSNDDQINLSGNDSAGTGKRKREPHRKIGFAELGKHVSKKWQEASDEVKEKYKAMAEQDKKRHQREKAEYLARKKAEFEERRKELLP